jgi:hypothetical protein
MFKTLNELAPLFAELRASVKGAANWIERVDLLRNSMPATLPGQPRMFDIFHAKELMFVAAFVKGGMRPAQASAYAALIMDEVKLRNPLPQWTVVAAGDFNSALPVEILNSESLAQHFGSVVPLTIVPLRAVAKMVDDLYEVA